MSVLVDLLSFLLNAVLVAAGVVTVALGLALVAVVAWLVVDDRKRRHASLFSTARVADALAETAMSPLAVDLATVETLTNVQAVSPSASPSAFPLYTPPPSAPSLPPVGSSLAVLDGRPDNAASDAAASDASDDANWPPQKPGAKTYRYIAVDGRLVRLRDLHRLEMRPPRWWELN